MSDVQSTTVTADHEAPEPVPSTTQQPETQVSTAEPAVDDVPAAESKPAESSADDQLMTEAAATDGKPAEPTPAAEKIIEPITEGQLNYKGPGLLKSLIASKKDFWITDEPCTAHELSSYLRGEKPDVAHPVVAWATQTGKGLLFFNKKGDTNRKQPGHVLALYDSTDLRKRNPQEISFSIAGHEHVLKAATDAERDAWFLSLEKSTELAKAQKEQIVESEGYKEELEKLNKPHVTATAAAVASKRGQSQPKKSTDAERPTSDAEEDPKKEKKARSTSRGVLNRFKGKKDEAAEPKKEEKEADAKPDDEHKTEEVAAVGIAGVGASAVGAAAVEEEKKDSSDSPAEAAKTEEKPKQSKRGSIFGKIGGWGAMKSPTKEKDAELKPEVPAKDGVAEEAPVLPETATTERTDPEVEADKIEAKAEKEVEQEHAAEEAKKEEVATPAKEKTGFLSGLLPKRNRSVSPSANLTKSEPEAAKETTEEATATETPAAEAVPAESAEKTEEPAKTETLTANKRQSVLGSLGRRASKAMSGMRPPKKENVAPAGEAPKEETTEATTEAETPLVSDGATTTEAGQPVIGDVIPSAITTSEQPPAVTASA